VPPRSRTPKIESSAVAAEEASPLARKPFLKWAGGKRKLLPHILPLIPKAHGTYFEPFVGGGALFFHLAPKRAVLADQNARLVATYRGVQGSVDWVISLLSRYPHTKEFFEGMRKKKIDTHPDAEIAAWLIYLNKTAFNGLYRVNSKNVFNVPFGDYVRPNVCDEKTLRAAADALAHAKILHADFEEATRDAKKGDVAYFDPPYVPLSASSSFTSYTSEGFDAAAQTRLRDWAKKLKKRGVRVILSNSSAEAVRELYADGFEIVEIDAARAINSKGAGRGKIKELLIT
jgi:DNA adenine methylase